MGVNETTNRGLWENPGNALIFRQNRDDFRRRIRGKQGRVRGSMARSLSMAGGPAAASMVAQQGDFFACDILGSNAGGGRIVS